MKRFFSIFILLVITLSLRATTYYVTTAANGGSDSHTALQAQTSSTGWLTLAHACASVSGVGDIIHVNIGTFIETSQCILAPGVNILGEGDGSHIISHVANADDGNNYALIMLTSPAQNTPGNQAIDHIQLDGDNLTGGGAIYMKFRSGVVVQYCTIIDFNYSGIVFEGENAWDSEPVTFSGSNRMIANSITNCHGGAGGGNIRITGQQGCTIYQNIIDGRARSMQNAITFSNIKSSSFFNNTVYTLNNRGSALNFAIEIWDTWGGLLIYGNTFIGGGTVDLGGHYTYKGTATTGASIYMNTFTLPAQEVYNSGEVIAITVESWQTIQNVYVFNNRITNFGTGVQVTFGQAGGVAENLYFYNNIFENIGYSDTEGGSSAIGFIDQGYAVTSWNNINILHNVMKAGGSFPYKGIRYYVMGANTNVAIKDNIIQGFGTSAISFTSSGGSMNTIGITNNILYSNGNTITGTSGFTNYTSSSNYTTNPSFVSSTNFHLQAGSPGIGTGVAVSPVTSDYDQHLYRDPPSIGAYEYSPAVAPTVTTTAVTSITENTASSGGNITDNGGLAVTARGVCWSTSANPTTSDSNTTDGTGSGSYASSITGLSAASVYHVRAYATSAAGTGYGADVQFASAGGTGRIFYVKNGGNNSRDGLSDANAWATVGYVNGKTFNAGDTILFKRGSTWSDALFVVPSSGSAGSPIYIGNYGTGNLPVFSKAGVFEINLVGKQYVTIDGLSITDPTISLTDHSIMAKIDYGINLNNSSNIIIRNCDISLVGCGMQIYVNSTGNTITNNHIHNLRMVVNTVGGSDDWGANGIIVGSSGNTITHNYFEEGWAPSYDYTYDGGTFEFFSNGGAAISNNIISYNTVVNCSGFLEIGGSAGGNCADNVIAYNLIINCGMIGSYHSNDGLAMNITNLQYYNNDIIQTVQQYANPGVLFYANNSPTAGMVVLKNNIFWMADGATDITWSFNSFQSQVHTNNYYRISTGSVINFTLSTGEASSSSATLFSSTSGSAATWDYHLSNSSPAIDAGTNVGFSLDLGGQSVNDPPDMGVYEHPVTITIPTVITTPITYITQTYAWGGGTVTSDGGGTVTVAGIVWDVNSPATLYGAPDGGYSNDQFFVGTQYPSYIAGGIVPGTTYYVRAYAKNGAGTAYGNEVSFTVPLLHYYVVKHKKKDPMYHGKALKFLK
jgi:hypothetical protein